jgi:hypothetical protein
MEGRKMIVGWVVSEGEDDFGEAVCGDIMWDGWGRVEAIIY